MYRRSLIGSAAAAGMLVRFLRIHIHRLAKRLIVIDPKTYSMAGVVAMMTGAMAPSA
jgi:hypothetical protein